MKMNKIFYLLLFTGIFLIGCKDDGVRPPDGSQSDYFPAKEGSYYTYDVADAEEQNQHLGERTVTFSGSQSFQGRVYNQQIDSLIFSDMIRTSPSYFRKTAGGVYYFIDTTGLHEYVPQGFTANVSIDNEMLAVVFPLEGSIEWIAYRLEFKSNALTIPVLEVKAVNQGKENVAIPLTSGAVTREAVKVRYIFKVTIPNPSNPFDLREREFSGYMWYVDGIGAVKWQGSSLVINSFGSGSINYSDTLSTVVQNLTYYKID
jgi:hypothetical protein